MTSPSFRDMENLSAYLDGHISPSGRMRLEKRIQSDAALAVALKELRQTRALLQRAPKRRASRNFTLTSRMAGIRPPVPRLVPAFAWASAVVMTFFIFTLGTNLVGQLSFETNAPMLAAAPSGFGGGPPAAATKVPAMVAPATMPPATAVPAPLRADQTVLATPTVEAFVMSIPEATRSGVNGVIQPSFAPKALHKPLTLWLFIWPSVGVLLGILALLVQWLNQRAFQRKNPRG